jgi:hypothetical protein
MRIIPGAPIDALDPPHKRIAHVLTPHVHVYQGEQPHGLVTEVVLQIHARAPRAEGGDRGRTVRQRCHEKEMLFRRRPQVCDCAVVVRHHGPRALEDHLAGQPLPADVQASA